MTADITADGPSRRRYEDLLRTERTMVWVRALAVVFGIVQVLTYAALPYPPGYDRVALTMVGGLAVLDLLVLAVLLSGSVQDLRTARAFALVTVTADTLLASGLVAAYSFDPDSAHWAILFVVPLLGAARFRLVGALATWAAVTILYVARQAYAAATFVDITFSPTSIVFRMGLASLVALVAGLLARDLAVERERTALALAEVERVDRLRANLVGSLAHDMRSPLTVIGGALAAIGQVDDEHTATMVELATRQSERLNRVAGGMLDLARLEDGDLIIERRPVRLAEIVTGAVASLQAADDDVRIRVSGDLVVTGDADRIDQIVYNLCSNALRHGAPPVEITATPQGDMVAVTVCDHGDGVPPERRDALFSAFATSATDGIGLGLWLVKALTEAHQGAVSYRPGPQGGACFEVHLPTGTAAAAD